MRNCPDPAKAVPAGQRLLCGEVAEWSNAAVLKTVGLHGPGGSNPSLSAIGAPYTTPNDANLAIRMLTLVNADRLATAKAQCNPADEVVPCC